MSISLRIRVGAIVFGLLIVGCPTGSDPGVGNGGAVDPDGSPGPGVDGGSVVGCGRLTSLCGEGGVCAGAPDCASNVCFGGVCKATAPADGTKNGDETDVDCGGSKSPACADGKGCLAKADCTSGVCTAMICQAPSPTDGVQNGDETGLDCGGSKAPKCGVGLGCRSNADCNALKCDLVQKKCLPASHSDGIKNDGETGIDCGGAALPTTCGTGQGCVSSADCNNVLCNPGTKLCDPPTAVDGLKNGSETDVDCGGAAPTNAPGCATGRVCAADADCGSKACNYAKKCVESISCKTQHGGDTCGPAGSESCCVSLPAGGVKLDKYNITAGRFRQFVDSLGAGGNMRAWLVANEPAGWPAAFTAALPTMLDNGGTDPDFTGIYQELGPNVHPPSSVGANEGCFIDNFGARTYRLPNEVNARMSDPQYNAQAFLDERSLNCVPVPLLAFCVWDGGKLATKEQIDVAWGAGKYPWGDASPPLGYQAAIGADPMGASPGAYGAFQSPPFAAAPLPAADLARADYNYNFWGGASRPDPPAAEDFKGKSCTQLKGALGLCPWRDYSIYVSPPGRFPTGNSATGHADLAGNVFNGVYPKQPNVADADGAADGNASATGTNAHWSRSGSWQGHTVPWTAKKSWLEVPASYKYWAMGGRCTH